MSISDAPFWRMARWTLLFLAALALPLAAQTGLGVIHGTVTDASHSLVVNAKVTLTNTATGVAQTQQSTSAGVFYFGAVRPGPYSLAVEFQSFKKWNGTLTLEVGQTAVIDPVLQVGSVDTAVEVTGAAPVIETEKGSLSDVKDALRIHDLPLNGRQIANLFNLTPGVEGGGAPRTNGMKVGATDMILDGVSLINRFGGGMAAVQPGLDTVQEYRIETAGSDAEFSRPATVSLITKSGTNDFHGNLFETFRNNYGGLVARKRQDTFSKPPMYIRNEFGASASGRIIKNKLFWFGSFEGLEQRQQLFAQTQVPDDAIWGGNFSGATDSSGIHYPIYDPLTTNAQGLRTPFDNNTIPSTRLSAFAGTMKSVTPEPNVAGANPWTDTNFKTYYPNTQSNKTFTGKVDEVFSEKDNLSVRFTRAAQTGIQQGGRFGWPRPGCTDCGGSLTRDFKTYSVFARENHVFSPTFMNEFQVSANRQPDHTGALAAYTDWASKLGLPNPLGATGWPTIWTDDGPFLYWDSDNVKDQRMTSFQIEDNVTWIKDKHTVRFGFRGRQEYNNVQESQQQQGEHGFYSAWTALYDPTGQQQVPNTGKGLASLELGLPGHLSSNYNRGYFYFQQKEFGLFAQDSWRVTPKLTVNYGLRWDKWTPYTEKYNRFLNLDPWALTSTGMEVITPGNATMESLPGIPSGVLSSWAARGLTWRTADQAGFPSSLTPAVNNDFGPRAGVAYRLNDKTVLRGSYGMYYWTMPLSQILQTSRTNPPLDLRFQNNSADRNGTVPNNALKNVPLATDYVDQAFVDVTGTVNLGTGSRGFTPLDIHNWADDRMQQWTFVFERQVARDTALRLSYIGNHGSNLEQRWGWNDPMPRWNYQAQTGLLAPAKDDLRRLNPNWSGQAVAHNGYSNNQSLQAEIERRFHNGLGFQAFYTWAHAMSTSDTGAASSGNGGFNANGAGVTSLVPENFMIMGNPNMTADQRLRLGYTNSGDVPPQHIRWNGVYELPFGKGKKFGSGVSGLVNHIIGGWSIAFIGEWRSGLWMGVNNGGYYLFGDPTLSKDERLDLNIFGKNQQLYFRGYFDPTKASGPNAEQLKGLVPADASQRIMRRVGAGGTNNLIPQRLADGTIVNTDVSSMVSWNARNFFQGPGLWNEDLSIYKTFTYKERYKLRFTGDFFNAFNHPNSSGCDSAGNCPVLIDTTAGLLDLSRQANDARIIQLSARFEF